MQRIVNSVPLKHNPIILLGLIILLIAAGLRLWGLPDVPPGPHYDEAANGILAAEIAQGAKRPIFIASYTGKEVLFFYGAALAMRSLGVGMLALRLTSALVGTLTVVVAGWLVYELFVNDDPDGAPWLALLTAAFVATSFWHVLLSRIGFRAVVQPLLQALTLAALWRGLRRNSWPWILLGGFFCGLTGYTYLAARVFPGPLLIGWVVLLILDRRARGQRWRQFVLFGLVAAVSFAPLGLYFVQHPRAFTTRIAQVGPGGDWGAALAGFGDSLQMLFLRGDPYIRFNLPLRPLLGPVMAVFLVVGLLPTGWRFLRPVAANDASALERAREAMLLTWIPVMLLPTALAVNEISPSNLRAVGLVPLLFLFPARGIWACINWTKTRVPVGPALTSAVLLLALLATGALTARAYFGVYAVRTDLYEASDGDLADIAAVLNRSDLTDTTVYVGSIHYRHPTLAFLVEAFSRIKWLVGASTVVYPADGEALYLFPRSATPEQSWLARYLSNAQPLTPTIASDGAPAFTGYRLQAPPTMEGELLADLSGVVGLRGYRPERAVSGDAIDVTVVWQVLAQPSMPGLTPFYHLEDPWGFRWGQTEPFRYAPEDWTPGEIVVDRVQVPIAPGAPPGDYVLKFGFYSQDLNQRLAIVDEAGRFKGTTVPLTVTVGRAETPPDPVLLGIRRALGQETGAGLRLLGVNLDTERVRPGEPVLWSLFWQAAGTADGLPDYAMQISLQNSRGDVVPLYNGAPVHGSYPTHRWQAGEIVVDRYGVRFPLTARGLPVGDYSLLLRATAVDGRDGLGPVPLGTVAVVATDRTFDVPPMERVQRVNLGNQIALIGYDLAPLDPQPGSSLNLTLYWRALAEMDVDYTVFTHVLGADGQVVAQQDNAPVHGSYPTTLWLEGEIVADPYEIALPTDLAPGEYPIEVGFYIPETGLRLAEPTLLDTVVSVQP